MRNFTLRCSRLLLAAVAFFGLSTASAQTVQIGTGTNTQRYPLGNWYGYERSASLYLASEIGVTGNILSLAWNANTAGLGARPIKVYLLETADIILTSQSWADQITGATLVYDDPAFTPVADWNTITLTTPFAYGGQNLLVLVEANVGGTGSTGSSGNSVQYSGATDKHAYWQEDGSEPTDEGTVTSNRPNIRLEFPPPPPCSGVPVAGIVNVSPASGEAGTSYDVSAAGYSQNPGVSYQWQSNTNGAGWVNEGTASATYADLTGLTAPAFGTVIEYRLEVTCTNTGDVAASAAATFASGYCTPVSSSTSDYIDSFSTTGGVANINHTATSITGTGYADLYSTESVSQIAGGIVNFSASYIGGSAGVSIWVDWNQNGVFDVTDSVYISTVAAADHTGSFVIQGGQAAGDYRMRVRARYDDTEIDPCTSIIWGEAKDFKLTVIAATTCSGTPDAGTATAPASVAVGTSYNVSSADFTVGDSLTYQWQSNTGGTGWVNAGTASATYANLNGLPAPAFGTTIEYRLVVICTVSGSGDTSNVAAVTSGYCIPTAQEDDSTGITNVTLGSLSNSSDGEPAYTDFTSIPVTVYIGASYPFSVSVNTSGNYTVNVLAWVDWNQNGIFGDIAMEAPLNLGSATDVTDGATSASPLSVFIPAAPAGQYRVRVRAVWNFVGTPTPCGEQSYSEAEDYLLDIQPAPAPTVTGFTPTNGCGGTATVVITGTGFHGVTAVSIGGTAVTSYIVDSDTQITAVAGTGTTGAVSVTAAGGTAVSTGTFTVDPAPVVNAISGATAEVCEGSTLTLANSTSGGVWAVANGTGNATITPNGLFTAVSAGTVTVTYTVTENGCPTAVNAAITINTTPGEPAITQNDTICAGGTATGIRATYVGVVTNFSGTTAGAPTYVRSNGGTTYSAGNTVAYKAHYFTVSVSGSYTFNQCAASYDGHGSLYQDGFSAASPATGFLVANDDGNDNNCSLDSRLTATLTAGTVYVLVSSAFSSSGSGDYTWTFDSNNPGDVIAPVGTIAWYTSATGGTSIGTGSPFNPVGTAGSGIANSNTAGVYTFYAETQLGSCVSTSRVPVSLVIDGSVPVTSGVTICAGSSAVLTATGSGVGLSWYDADSNLLATGNTYTTAPLSADTVFYVQDSTTSGCVSRVAVAVTVGQPVSTQNPVTLCAGESVTVGTSTYNAEGTYTDTLASFAGCDSIVTTSVTVLPVSQFSQTLALCAGESVTVGSNTYTQEGTYTDILTAANSCDSVVTTTITVTAINVAVNTSGNTATAAETGATYQWINCATNQPVSGETGQSFSATTDGDYKVTITKNGCSSTSNCVSLVKTGIGNVAWANSLNIYPNPTSGLVNIAISNITAKELFITVTDVQGRLVYQSEEQINASSFTATINLNDAAKGVYLIKLNTENDAVVARQLILK